jgi:glycosyltransferase involved in cell wall biosynthesis
MDYWHICQRVTLLRPDGTCCPGPRDPADCAACRIADRGSAQRFGTRANRAIRQVIATTGHLTPRTPLGHALGVADFAERRESIADALGQVSMVVVNSRFLAQQLTNLGVPTERVLVVRQGIDSREYAEPSPRTDGRGGSDALQVLYLGQISWHKGADLAIDAVGRLHASGQGVRLRLHGPVTAPAPYLAQLKARIIRIPGGGKVVGLEPPLDRAGLIAALRAADVLVVPSRWYENSPNVILEAFAAGTPVVAANHGGMAEMVHDGVDGLLFAPGDAESLASVLRRLRTEPELLPRLRAGIRRPGELEDEMTTEEVALDRLLTLAPVAR